MFHETSTQDEVCTEDDLESTSLLRPSSQSSSLTTKQKLRYPIPIYFIIAFEFFERYSHYTFQTILVIYLNIMLGYSDDSSTAIYHLYIMVIYLLPLVGSIIAESWIGNFKTILYFSILYVIGNVGITLGSAANVLHIDAKLFIFVGLALNAIGTGVIKPCVSTFGGEQFTLPEQQVHLDRFFSLFIFSISASSLLAMFISPILRHDITCLQQESCYPLAYGLATIVMLLAVVVFMIGYKTYKLRKPEDNILVDAAKCIGHSLIVKRETKRDHWLDHADQKYDVALIEDIKATLKVLILFVPLPVYWALFQQLGSRWTLQAARMDGSLGFYNVKPEQVQVINSLLMLAFIPLFDTCIYPLLGKCNLLKRPLQRLGTGMFLAALAFVLSAIVEFKLQSSYAVLPGSNEGQVRFYNSMNCSLQVQLDDDKEINIDRYEMAAELHVPIDQAQYRNISLFISQSNTSQACNNINISWSGNVTLTRQKATSYLITYDDQGSITVQLALPYDDATKTYSGNPKFRFIYQFIDNVTASVTLVDKSDKNKRHSFVLNGTDFGSNYTELDSGSYNVICSNITIADITMSEGGVYALLVQEEHQLHKVNSARLFTITMPNSLSMYWLLPQHTVLTMSEVMVSITGLAFSFTQAPKRMKSILTAAWLLSSAFGDLIIVIVAEVNIFNNQAYEYLFYTALMMANLLVFVALTLSYKYVENTNDHHNYNTFENETD